MSRADPAPPPGLREIKKQRTRAAIAEAALELFTARGFEAVTTAEIARAAEVSEATLFNYFRTKEDLIFDRLELFWVAMIEAVENRRPGEGIVDAVERFLLDRRPVTDTPEQEARLAAIARMIAASPALLARERASYDHAAMRLAEVIAKAGAAAGNDALAAAHMILGVHKALVAYTRAQVTAGISGLTLARRVAARTRSGYALLRRGFRD